MAYQLVIFLCYEYIYFTLELLLKCDSAEAAEVAEDFPPAEALQPSNREGDRSTNLSHSRRNLRQHQDILNLLNM